MPPVDNLSSTEDNETYYPHTCSATSASTSSLALQEIKCKGNKCSMHGINFCSCIMEVFPVEDIILEDIKSGCHFTSHIEYDSFMNKNKRFLLYWYHSVNFYFVTSKHNQCNLPACLIWAIWDLYLKAADEEYTPIRSEMSDVEIKEETKISKRKRSRK